MISINGRPLEVTHFPDGTSQIWKLDEWLLKETNYMLVEWKFDHEGEFMQLVQLKYLLEDYDIKASLKLPYLPYGRQDKNISNDKTFGLIPFAQLINFLDFQDVIIVDPHSEVALQLINDSRAFYPVKELEEISSKLEAHVFCYPDKGAVQKYTYIYDHAYVYADKVREQSTGKILSIVVHGDVRDKIVLIVDDICDFGGTFIKLTEKLKEAGAKEVNLFITHGLFSGGTQVLFDAGINRVFTKNGEVSPDGRKTKMQF